MCGICGVIAPYSKPQWRADMLTRLLKKCENRGSDSTGIAYVDDTTKQMVVLKNGVKAEKFVEQEDYLKAVKSLPAIVMGHCRAATKRGNTGSDNNDNNHPFFAPESGIALMHNGLIQDDERWRETYGHENGIRNKPKSVVDSETLLMVIETFFLNQPEGQRSLIAALDDAAYNVSGGYALGLLKQDEPNSIWLLKHRNPIVLAWVPSQRAILFASEEKFLKEVLSTSKEIMDFFIDTTTVPSVINDMNEDHLVQIELTPNGSVPFRILQRRLDVPSGSYRATQVATPLPSAADLEPVVEKGDN